MEERGKTDGVLRKRSPKVREQFTETLLRQYVSIKKEVSRTEMNIKTKVSTLVN